MTLPIWVSLLPPTASPHSAVRSSLGRLSADPGRRQSPLPSTQTLRCRDPALKDSPGHPCLNIHLHTPLIIPGRKQPSCPVSMMMWQGSPALEHVLLFHTRKVVRVHLTAPIGCGMCQLLEISSGTAASLPCCQRPTVSTAVKISLPDISQKPPTADFLFHLSALLLSPRCLQAVTSALLGFAEELLLGRAVSLQHCLGP